MAKRTFDVVLSAIALVVTSPLLAIGALLVLIGLGRPVLFRQTRPGLHEVPFELLKLRTMRPADAAGSDDAARLTSIGSFLRRTSLDELPQLINVIRGDMSLVGPRPLLIEYLPRYSPAQARRFEVKPGITGLAQVRGRNRQSWEERFALDVWYVDNRTMWLDLRILGTTLWRVATMRGVSADGHATMPPFTGEEGVGKE